jgi:hypothetical protein
MPPIEETMTPSGVARRPSRANNEVQAARAAEKQAAIQGILASARQLPTGPREPRERATVTFEAPAGFKPLAEIEEQLGSNFRPFWSIFTVQLSRMVPIESRNHGVVVTAESRIQGNDPIRISCAYIPRTKGTTRMHLLVGSENQKVDDWKRLAARRNTRLSEQTLEVVAMQPLVPIPVGKEGCAR